MEEKTVKSLQALKSAEFRMERTTMEESDEELVEANSGKKGRSERGRRTRRKHIYHKRKRARKKSKKEELSEEKHEVSSVSTVELPGPRSESESVAQDDGESLFCVEREGKKLRAEAEVFIPNFFQQQQQPTIFIEEWWSKTVNYAIPYGHNSRALSVDSLTEEELTFVASTIGDDELHELSEYTTPIIHCAISDDQKNRLEFMRTELDGRKEIEKTEFYLAKKSQDWANWAVAAAEAERCRRLVALAELEEEARKERIRRQAWAVEAVAIEKRRQLGLDLLSTASNSRWWLEEVLGGGSGAHDINSVKDDDYELVCPYACFGCTHVCPRSRLTEHLAHCCSAEGAFRAPNQSQRNKDQEEQISHCLSSVNDDRMKNEDETAHYLVVCPNAVMGCRVVCRRGVELQRHLDACPFSDSTRQNERAQREQLRAIVATQAEQERARRVDADFRATLASAAARAARRALGIDDTSTGTASAFDDNIHNENHQIKNSSGNNGRRTKQAAVIKKQQKAAMLALGGELRNWWEAQNENCETGRERRRQAIENVRCAVIQAFEDMAARLLGRASKKICAPVTVELFGSCAYGLDSENSDLDLVVRGWDQACTAVRGNATWVLHRLAQQLRGHASIKILKIIDRARVPVIKARVEIIPLHTNNDNHVLVDLSLATSSHTGLEAAGLCRSLLKSIPALAPTALALKRLLAQHGLNDPFTGGLPSYAVILMVFYSRLHSKHAETHLQHRRGHPFERSVTLSDDSWRMNAFGQILKKTRVPTGRTRNRRH